MNVRLAALAAAFATVVSGPAHAQWPGVGINTNVALTEGDFDLITATLQRYIHGKPPDTVASWRNPSTGNSGTIMLLRGLVRGGMRCEQLAYEIRSSARSVRADYYTLVSCLQPDGTWKLVS